MQPDPRKTKYVYSICTMSAQRLRRWSNTVQMYTNILCLLGNTILPHVPWQIRDDDHDICFVCLAIHPYNAEKKIV